MPDRQADIEEDAGVELSIVIPTLDEETVLADTLLSIRNSLATVRHEIIVVDNGSSDGTVRVGRDMAEQVIVTPGICIGEMRNRGVEVARGEVLLFNDADVRLTREWTEAYLSLSEEIRTSKTVLGGSLQIPDRSNPIHRYWFEPLLQRREGRSNYVGAANLLVSKSFFSELGGFNPDLRTGEDYEFCARARRAGAIVLYAPKLAAVHLGYPATVSQFFRREHWHGKGDLQTTSALLSSKLAIFSIVVSLFTLFAALSALLFEWRMALWLVVFIALLVVFLSFYRAPRLGSPLGRVYHIALTMAQCLARGTAGFGAFRRTERRLPSRPNP